MKKFGNILKRISAAAVCAALLSAAVPVPWVQAADNVTVVLDPSDASPFNGGQFEGWGTSLCWWANRIGYSEKMTQEAARLFFSDEGLSLDIARYNVGGGDDPTHNHITRSDSAVPGYATGFNEDGVILYDWTKDENQRNIAAAAKQANPDLYFEGFSNSPPYFMTNSGCSSGADPAGSDNLKSGQYDNFAKYIADVTKHFKEEWGIEFESYSPMNEPDTAYWGVNSYKQEGCHFDPGTSQSKMITATRKALDDAELDGVIVAGMDETSIDKSVTNLDKLTDEAKQALGRIDTHSYEGSKRAELKAKAVFMNKTLWMSEVDNGNTAGTNPGNMGAGLNLANRILNDMNGMQPAAWVIWDIIDSHKDSKFNSEKNTSLNQSAGLWGVGMADHDKEEIMLTQKYYVFGQFTRYIQPGDTIIASSDSTLAAYNKNTGAIKIVAVNTAGSAKAYTFDMSAFSRTGAKAKAFRTSGSFSGGEHWKELDDIDVADKKFDYELPANSVTTFVIEQEDAGSVGYITVKGSSLVVKGNEYTYTSTTSDKSAVSWSVSDESVAVIDSTGKLTPIQGGVVTVTASSETAGSNSMEVTVMGVPKIQISEDAVTGTNSWKNDAETSVKKLVDGNLNTFFDGLNAGWAVFDLGSPHDIAMIGYAPRTGYEYRMIDGKFSASKDNKTWTELYTVKSAPVGGKITYVTSDELHNADQSYRYIKYEIPDGTQSYNENGKQESYNCNLAEVEIYGEEAVLTDEELVAEAAEAVNIDKEIYGNIYLPEKIGDVDIEWSVSDVADSPDFVINEFEILENQAKYLCTVPSAYRKYTAYFAIYDSDNQIKAVRSAYINHDGDTLFGGSIEGDFEGCTPKLMVWDGMTPAGDAADKVSEESSEDAVYALKTDGTVTRGSEDVRLYLTAVFKKGDEILEKKYEVTVKAAAQDKTDMAAYLFVHFIGTESDADSEQIYFSVSQDGTSWKTLNEGTPILRSEVGEKGVRDPHIIRSPEGDRFFLIATDLSIYNRKGDSNRWATCQTSGSKSIVVWQSTDLVNWSEAELVKVAPDNAGCTWAPESVYDDETGSYMVFWASKTADDNYGIQRIYRCFTRDFKNFTEPELYMDGGTVSNIDTTIIKEGDTYYRFTKNESKSSIIMEKSNSLSSGFTAVDGYKINGVDGNTVEGYEGPTAYKINGEDKWCLLLDYFSKSQGYKPFVTEDLSAGEFISAADFSFDGKYRHGGVMPITQAEYDALVRAYMPAEETGEVIFSLDFDNETAEPSVGKAKVNGEIGYTEGFGTAGKAAVLDGSDFIEITKDDGTPLLAGLETFTLSFASKANKQSWWFYAAPNTNTQEYQHEKYVGVLDSGTEFKCERYNNSGARSDAAGGKHDSEWQYVTIVYRRKSYTLYINGGEISRVVSAAGLKTILGDNPIAYIGKANWGDGEYSNGAIDEFKVYNYALSDDEVKTAYADYTGKELN